MAEMDLSQVAARAAQRLRAIAVKETVPFRTGELRKSVHVTRFGSGWLVGTNKVYARAVHEGRRALIIRPKRKRALAWGNGDHPVRQVFQRARRGRPFFRDAIDRFEANLDDEARSLGIEEGMAAMLAASLRAKGLQVRDLD